MINVNKKGSFSINKFSLSFNKRLEVSFLKKYFSNSIFQFRIAFLLNTIIYAAFAYLDTLVIPEYATLFYFIRFYFVVPLCSFVLILSFFRFFEKIWQSLVLVCHITSGVGLSIMTMLASENYSYYAGMVLIFLVGYFFIKLRFLYATIANWSILIFFNIIFINHPSNSDIILISYNLIFISANLIGMVAAYNIEYYARKDFYLNKELDMQKEAVENYSKNLEYLVQERTKELEKAKNEAEKSDKLKSAFLANMSHEIRTPMNGIFGFTRLLKELNLKGEPNEYINIIEQSGLRMLNLINDIIDISKIESGLVISDIKATNLSELIKYIYTFFKPEAKSKGIQLQSNNQLSGKDIIIKTDHEKIYAVLTNLVKNAIKFTESGTIEFGYHLEHNKQKITVLQFHVKDSGIGIPIDKQRTIFDRFMRADICNEQVYEGAGLGLSISKAYVEMLGGEIWLKSKEGVGSTFYFTIPYIPDFKENITNENIVRVNPLNN
jgi:signal transduction histidine kinase